MTLEDGFEKETLNILPRKFGDVESWSGVNGKPGHENDTCGAVTWPLRTVSWLIVQ